MPNPTSAARVNRPVWNTSTSVSSISLTGGFDAVPLTGYYIVLSNIGANNVWVGPSNSVPGILLQPGESFETAVLSGSGMYVFGTAGQPVSVVQYAEA